MAYRRLLEDIVQEEVAAAARWYQRSQPGLGSKFRRTFHRRTLGLLRNPFLYQRIFRAARAIDLDPFPYRAIYYVHGKDVIVAACVHEKRDPDLWQSRIPDLEP